MTYFIKNQKKYQMSHQKAVGNSMGLYEEHHHKYDEGQVFNLRMKNDCNLGAYRKVYHGEVEALMDIDYPKVNETVKLNFLREQFVLGKRHPEDIVFLAVDSNVACQYDVVEGLSNIRENLVKNGFSENAYIILIDTYVSRLENEYKLENPYKYMDVNMNNIEKYLSLVNGDMMFDDNIVDYIHNVDQSTAYKLMYEEEVKYYSGEKYYYGKLKNEINDNVQLEILLKFRDHYVGSSLVFFTKDNGLKKKCRVEGVFTELK